MTILLINNNPVVSRLLSLCTRDVEMVLEKVSTIDEASAARYDVLLVDEGSCEGDVASLSTRLDVGKKIYLSYSDDPIAGFDETIKKPFLPSQIMKVLNNVEVREAVDEVFSEDTPMDVEEIEEISYSEDVPSIFPLSAEEVEEVEEEVEEIEEDVALEVLNRDEIEKIKALLDMDEEETEVLDMNEETYESRKIEVIKEQLIAEGLEIFEEEEIVDELSKDKEVKEKSKIAKIKTEQKNKKKKKKNEKYTKDERSIIEDAFEDAINKLKPKKIKKLLKGKEIEVKIEFKGKK